MAMSRGLTEAAKQAAKNTPFGYETMFEYRRTWYTVTAFPSGRTDGKTYLVRREDRTPIGKIVL